MWLACHWTGWFYISDLGRRPSRHGGLLESSGWRNTKPFSKGGHEWSRRVTTSDPCSDCSVGLWKVTSHKYVLQLVHNLPSDFPDSKAPCFGIWRFRNVYLEPRSMFPELISCRVADQRTIMNGISISDDRDPSKPQCLLSHYFWWNQLAWNRQKGCGIEWPAWIEILEFIASRIWRFPLLPGSATVTLIALTVSLSTPRSFCHL